MLLAEPDHVRTALAGIEQERERKPRLRSNEVTFFELLGPTRRAMSFFVGSENYVENINENRATAPC